MDIYKNGVLVDEYIPSYGNRKLIIAIDSSKTNTGIVVGDEYGNILDDYEISGSGRANDVYDLCAFTRTQLKSLLRGADILFVGIEDIITKKEKGYKGIDYHQSRAVITAVFNNFMFFFEEVFGVRPTRINNWDWKVGVLPEEYRKRTHDKGSIDWFNDLGNKWSGRKDDVTDAVCIFMHIVKKNDIKAVYQLKETQPANVKYEFCILPISATVPSNAKEFTINNNDSLQHNLDTIANSIDSSKIGVLRVPIESISIDWIWSDKLKYSSVCYFERCTTEVYLIVERK